MDYSIRPLPLEAIPEIIEKAALFGGKVSQLNPSVNLQSLIKKIEIDIYGTMTITLFEALPLERNRPISISFNYRNLTFYLNSSQYVYKGDVIIADSPSGAKALSVRDHERYVLPLDQKIQCSIRRIEKRGVVPDLEAHVLDISLKGMGIIIPHAEEESLIQHDHLWIKSIHGIHLDKPIFGRIVYVTNRKFKDNVIDCKAGISLENQIPGNIFGELKGLSRLVLE